MNIDGHANNHVNVGSSEIYENRLSSIESLSEINGKITSSIQNNPPANLMTDKFITNLEMDSTEEELDFQDIDEDFLEDIENEEAIANEEANNANQEEYSFSIKSLDGYQLNHESAIDFMQGAMETTEGIIETIEGAVESDEGIIESTEGTIEFIKGKIEKAEGKIEKTEGTIESNEGTEVIVVTEEEQEVVQANKDTNLSKLDNLNEIKQIRDEEVDKAIDQELRSVTFQNVYTVDRRHLYEKKELVADLKREVHFRKETHPDEKLSQSIKKGISIWLDKNDFYELAADGTLVKLTAEKKRKLVESFSRGIALQLCGPIVLSSGADKDKTSVDHFGRHSLNSSRKQDPNSLDLHIYPLEKYPDTLSFNLALKLLKLTLSALAGIKLMHVKEEEKAEKNLKELMDLIRQIVIKKDILKGEINKSEIKLQEKLLKVLHGIGWSEKMLVRISKNDAALEKVFLRLAGVTRKKVE